MVTHCIIMSSSYSNGTRIAVDYIVNENTTKEDLKCRLSVIINSCGKDVSISTHMIQTDSSDFDSVRKKDSFFDDVELIGTLDEFISLIKKDRELLGIDVAKYILCLEKCTHLKLEKLVYLCYAEYLCEFGDKLFKDNIYSYKYGPVVESVYDRYKVYGYKEMDKDVKDINNSDIYKMPSRSRILFAKDGVKKLDCIEKTLKKYGICSANELVDLTHKPNTPWSKSGRGTLFNEIISDEVIEKYHKNEQII